MEIAGKKAVICGGASGMAKATAQLLRQKGANIAINNGLSYTQIGNPPPDEVTRASRSKKETQYR